MGSAQPPVLGVRGLFAWVGWEGGVVKLPGLDVDHSSLVLTRLRISGGIPPLPCTTSWLLQGLLYVYFLLGPSHGGCLHVVLSGD